MIVSKQIIALLLSGFFAIACQTTEDLDSGVDEFSAEEFNADNNHVPSSKEVIPAIASHDHDHSLSSTRSNSDLLPANAKAGECFARVLVPAKYSTQSVQVLQTEERELATVIPAKYKWSTERVQVKAASKKLVHVPAQYASVSERILERPAYTTWKKGKGGIADSNSNNATGEVLCKVEVPAKYKTVTKRVLKNKGYTKEIEIPAQYKTVKVQEISQEARVVTKTIPATYRTITRRTLVEQPSVQWDRALCQTNATPSKIKAIQSALIKRGFLNGKADGVLGSGTLGAVKKFQVRNNLPSGAITLNTVKALGLSL